MHTVEKIKYEAIWILGKLGPFGVALEMEMESEIIDPMSSEVMDRVHLCDVGKHATGSTLTEDEGYAQYHRSPEASRFYKVQ